MAGNYDSWEDDPAAQEENLSQQTRNMNLNQSNTFRPGASSFQPGAAAFQPTARNFQPQNGYPQQYASQQYGYNPQYQQYQQYPQYNQPQSYGGQFAAAQQSPGNFQRGPISIAKRPTGQSTPPPAPNEPQSSKPAESVAPPKAKVLSIGVPSEATAPPKTKVLSIGIPAASPAAPPSSSSPTTATPEKPTAAAKAMEKAKPSPPSSGKSSPTPADGPKKSRNADEVAQDQAADVDEATLQEMYGKEHVNLIFIGHVDAGKSTLGGQILALTGMVDERTLEKYKREAKDAGRETWYFSWVLDLNKEERAKGKTVEVGRGFFETERRRYTILDAPGHKTFVPNMIGGASQADIGILVISARKGEYETGFEKGGQTREHAMLAKTQGVNKLVIAVNKMDDPTVEWSQARYNECITKLTIFLKGLGYNPKTDLGFLPLSAQTGLGVRDRVPKDVAPWNNAPSLLEYLDNMEKLERKIKAPFMMPIGGKYRDLGTMVEGRVEAGVIQKGSSYIMMPNREDVGIAALYGETEDEIPYASCGDQIRIRLRGIEEEDILPGYVLCSPKRLVHCVKSFEAQIQLLPELRSILSAGFPCVLHVHAAIEEVTFVALLHRLEKGTGRKSKKPPPFAKKGDQIIARLDVTSGSGKVCIERFEDYAQMGRFTLRDQGLTIAIGKVTRLITDEE